MLVKKFEAPSMKEALEMVKTQLGPDAVILAAKENGSAFGLMQKGSVEITAAVSETQLKKKQFAESRLKPEDRERLRSRPATAQRQFIQKSVSRYVADSEPTPQQIKTRASVDSEPVDRVRRYIDIADEAAAAQPQRRTVAATPSRPIERPKMTNIGFIEKAKEAIQSHAPTKPSPTTSDLEVSSLKAEVQQLRTLLESFRKSPVGPMTYHPGADHGLPFEVSPLFEKLNEAGISPTLSTQICREALSEMTHDQLKKKSLVEGWAARKILGEVVTSAEPTSNGLHLFLGPSGQGKTSCLVKLASHLVLNEKKSVAILTCDTHKVGASDQLKIYSSILNVPFGIIRNGTDWDKIAGQLSRVDCILVDYSGSSLKTGAEINQLQSLLPPSHIPRHTHLVLSVNQRDADAFEFARRYRLAQYKDVIFTKLDESTVHGLIYNTQKEFAVPLHSFGVGPLIPEDFEIATKERVVDLIFRISKVKGV